MKLCKRLVTQKQKGSQNREGVVRQLSDWKQQEVTRLSRPEKKREEPVMPMPEAGVI